MNQNYNQNESLRCELLNMRNEYQNLFNFYHEEIELKSKLEAELSRTIQKHAINEQSNEAEIETLEAD